MAESILRLTVNSEEYDNKLKQATNGLTRYIDGCRKVGGTLEVVEKETLEYVRALGQMDTTSRTATGKLAEMKKAFVELSAQYKQMSDAEKNSPVGKALAQSLDELKPRIIDTKNQLDEISSSLKGMSSNAGSGGLFSGLGEKMSGALQVFAGNMLTKAAGAVANLGSEMYGMIQQGIELAQQGEGIRAAFERLGRGDILDGLRQATHGTVTDIELMKAAVKFNDFKLPLDELGVLLQFAQQKAKDTGQSVDYMVESITTGLGRKSLMILDNLGLSASEIKERMGETGDMTKAVGAIIREQMQKAGDYVETAADRAAQANVEMQNKLEELGRTFAPIQEAGVGMFNRLKMAAIDALNGMRPFFDQFTEAGRIRQQAEGMGGNDKVSGQLNKLKVARAAGSDWYVQSSYNNTIQEYEKQLSDLNLKIAAYGKGRDAIERGNIARLKEQKAAVEQLMNEYKAGAKQYLQPVRSVIDTKGAEQNVESLKLKLIELEAQRKKAIAAGDTDLSKNLAKQISQVKSDIKGLGGTTTTRTTTTPKTEEQQNTARIAELVKQYQDLATAAKTADDAQKAGLTERMAKIQGEIKTLEDRNTELKKFADEARQVQFPVGSLPQLNEQLKTLQTEQAKALDAKQWQDYQRQIEQTQYQIDALKGKWQDGLQATFKLNIEQQGSTDINTAKPDDIAVTFRADDSDVLEKLRGIEGVNIDPKTLTVTANTADAYNQVQQLLKSVDDKTVTFAVQPKMETGTSITNDAGMSAYITSIKQQLETADYGTSLYNGLSAQLADMTTLKNLVGESLKAGLGTAMFEAADATGKDFWTRAMEGGVENTDWQAIVEKINEKLKEMNLDPIAINFKTGETKSQSKEMSKDWSAAANAIQAVGSAMSQIEDPAAKVVGTVAQAIATIALGYAQATTQAATAGPWAWIAFAATGLATMISTITAIHSATGYANGGMIKGNSYSGDNIGGMVDGGAGGFVGLNAGEVVLNAAQQRGVASALSEGGNRRIEVFGRLSGETIFLSSDRYTRRTGRGTIITWK